MLHGGTEHSTASVDGRSAPWRRALAMQRAIAHRAHADATSVWLLRYRRRGWNEGSDVVDDARWALDRVRAALGSVPVVLLGHSMGARVAVHVADDEAVRGVVGLAPWWPAGEPVDALRDRKLVGAHGRRDRITSFSATERFVERAGRVASSAQLRDMGPVGHYMLKRARAWNRVALTSCQEMLID